MTPTTKLAQTFESWKPFAAEYDLPFYSGDPGHAYLIASTQRSGSYFLSYLLFGTGQLGVPLEYLHPDHFAQWQRHLGAVDMREMVRKLFERRTSPNGWFGIKAHWNHFDHARREGLDEVITFDRYIRIERKDRLAQAVSLALARKTKSWLSLQKPIVAPKYDSHAITRAIKTLDSHSRKWDAWAASTGVKPLHVYYEDLAADPLRTINQVLSEFGLDSVDSLPPVPIQKQTSQINEQWKRRYLGLPSRLATGGRSLAKQVYSTLARR